MTFANSSQKSNSKPIDFRQNEEKPPRFTWGLFHLHDGHWFKTGQVQLLLLLFVEVFMTISSMKRLAYILMASFGITLVTYALDSPIYTSKMAKNPTLFLQTVDKQQNWEVPSDPTRIVGPIYFVGTKGLAAWLITTQSGHILLNTGMPKAGPMIEESIRKLGFKPEDIKIILVSHAHIDHAGALAYFKKLTGAQVAVMGPERILVESGGKADFQYSKIAAFRFTPVRVNRVLKDGDTIQLGSFVMTAHLTPGHTRGSTTFTARVSEGIRTYDVVFPDGTTVNPGYRLGAEPSYPNIVTDYRRTFAFLDSLNPDIWLHSHTMAFDFDRKRDVAAVAGVKAWVDPNGYKTWLQSERAKFNLLLSKERRTPVAVNERVDRSVKE